jgi:predicted Rossmann fold flavoprotein
MENNETQFDVAVIGAGPAGMMAAIAAADAGSRVVMLEKNSRPGIKLMLTGNGRCNFTNAEPDLRKLAGAYGVNGPFLFHAFSRFGSKDIRNFFAGMGVSSKVEDRFRVFPETDKAKDILEALENRLRCTGVVIKYETVVTGFSREGRFIKEAVSSGGAIKARNYIISTGGRSYEVTGSTGDGYRWARDFGHKVIKPKPMLVPVKIKDFWVKNLSGVSLGRAGIRVIENGKKSPMAVGECLFTHFGLSGPLILDLSGRIGKALENGPVKLLIGFFPGKSQEEIEQAIIDNVKIGKNKELKNCFTESLPKILITSLLSLVHIDPEKPASSLTREERRKLTSLLFETPVTATGLLGFDLAIITGGGVDSKEIDAKTMRSKLVDNLFFAGEVINVHGITGGYNLQQCWSTGYLAGVSATKNL